MSFHLIIGRILVVDTFLCLLFGKLSKVWKYRLFSVYQYGPRPLKSTGRHWPFLNLTCDIGLSEMRHGGYKCSDMGHANFLKFDM